MNLFPDPFHPAVVHFPIALILVGTAFSAVVAFWRKSPLTWVAAVLLGLGALGAWSAVESGESAGGLLEKGTPEREALVDSHETWAKRTLMVTTAAAALAVATALLGAWPRIARGVSILAIIASASAAFAVYETGHRGGELVYRHGAGVEMAARQNEVPLPHAPDSGTNGKGVD
jgi:uncharacterized membrane protein